MATVNIEYNGVNQRFTQNSDGSLTPLVDTTGGASGGLVSQTAATMPAFTQMQQAAVANGPGTSLNVQGFAVAILNIVSSPSMSGGTTVNFEASSA